MNKTRLEAFSDGVLAIIITIMVLEFRVPHGYDWAALKPLFSVFLSYVLSFVFMGIYWNNHHHLLHTVRHVNGKVLWANLHLLFWLSLIPFVTNWMGESGLKPWPVAAYGVVLLLSGVAYFILAQTIIAHQGKDSLLAKAIGNDVKGKISVTVYAASIPLAFWMPLIACLGFVTVALMWFVPDRRIENVIVPKN